MKFLDAGCCEPSGSINGREFEELIENMLLKEDPAA
jgi:hypothetical protein